MLVHPSLKSDDSYGIRVKDEKFSVGDDGSAVTSDGEGGGKGEIMGRTGGKGDAPNSSACWSYRIRAGQSMTRKPDDTSRDLINFVQKVGLSYLLFQCVVGTQIQCVEKTIN